MPPRKRAAEAVETTRRTSRRTSTIKSQYFESSDATEESDAPPPKKRGRPAKKQLKKEESEESYGDELAKEEPEEEGEDDDDEDDEDAPMKVTIIPLEKMRDTDGVEYQDFKLHKNTLLFLRDLKANNQRPWLKCKCNITATLKTQLTCQAHDGEYRRALKDWNSFVECTSETVIEADETIPELPIKDLSFRIHRDIRFSKDPTPYKVCLLPLHSSYLLTTTASLLCCMVSHWS